MTDKELRELYQERAEYAKLESSCQDVKKYIRHGGILWRLFDWIESSCAEARQELNEEISRCVEKRRDMEAREDS